MAASTLTRPDGVPAPAGVTAEQAAELEARRRTQTKVRWELLSGMVRKDLKLKYQNSALGFVWSLINPLFLLAVYVLVFDVVLKSGIPDFPVYLMAGLLLWNLFSGSVGGATTSVVANGGLVKKVRFPLLVLPLSSVGFALVHYVLQMMVFLVVVLVLSPHSLGLHTLVLVPGVALTLTFSTALALFVSALNVRYRDIGHLLELLLFAWFWATATIYASGLVTTAVRGPVAIPRNAVYVRLFFADPMATAVALLHRAFAVDPRATTIGSPAPVLPASAWLWYVEQWAVCMAISLVLLWLGVRMFRKRQADFAEEL